MNNNLFLSRVFVLFTFLLCVVSIFIINTTNANASPTGDPETISAYQKVINNTKKAKFVRASDTYHRTTDNKVLEKNVTIIDVKRKTFFRSSKSFPSDNFDGNKLIINKKNYSYDNKKKCYAKRPYVDNFSNYLKSYKSGLDATKVFYNTTSNITRVSKKNLRVEIYTPNNDGTVELFMVVLYKYNTKTMRLVSTTPLPEGTLGSVNSPDTSFIKTTYSYKKGKKDKKKLLVKPICRK